MNPFIKEQLKKTKIALPPYDDNTTELFIPRTLTSSMTIDGLIVDQFYQVYLAQYVVVEPEGFTLSANWNKGTVPPENRMNIKVIQIMGKMVQIAGVGCTTNISWHGWVPIKAISILDNNF